MSEKIYFGQAKEFKFEDGGTVLNISFSLKDLDNMKGHTNEKGFINLKCQKRKEPSQYGQTHSIILSTYEAKKKDEGVQGTQVSNAPDDLIEEDIPFN